MGSQIVTTNERQWDRWFKLASIATTAVVIPGIAWAVGMTRDISEVRNRVEVLSQQIDMDRRGMANLCDEIKGLRTSVETLRSDVLQRLTRVETRLDSNQNR